MSITTNKEERVYFSPSVNIIRDATKNLAYIPTPNSIQVFQQLLNDYHTGTRSFCIVGAYGTGKSSFLWAFQQSLENNANRFGTTNHNLVGLKAFEFMLFVGEYESLSDSFAQRLAGNTKDYSTESLIGQLDKYRSRVSKSGKGLAIIVDEFGKYLEFAAKNNPASELYFIQQLAEYVNDPKNDVIFITTLHQDFSGYSKELSKSQQQEWDKVKGRLREITFNEPVEQLLYLASERLSSFPKDGLGADFESLFKAIEKSKAFPLRDYFVAEVGRKLLPFDLLSAATMTVALQKYGQNERSLFSFIESNDPMGISSFSPIKEPYYNIVNVYDYLSHNFYSFLTTKNNPHYTQWAALRIAIERTEGVVEINTADAVKIIKAIGMVNIFAAASAQINDEFLVSYGAMALGLANTQELLKELSKRKIIRFVKHSNTYVLFEGTDLDIELAIDAAGNLVERVSNITQQLEKHFEFPFIAAKSVFYKKGTPRYFAFKLKEDLSFDVPTAEIDGYINLIFSESVSEDQVKKASANCDEAVLFGWYRNTDEIQRCLFEILKVEKVKEENPHDKIALRELENILQHQVRLLNHYILGNLYNDGLNLVWFYKGEKLKITSHKLFNQTLSRICEEVYPLTPTFRNEMVNKTKLSGAINTAKKALLSRLEENWEEDDLGFDGQKFPPEKTIYLSLLKETGIHRNSEYGWELGNPQSEHSFVALWDASIGFLYSSRSGKRSIQDFVDTLSSKPFKLKKGFVDIWLPCFLFCNRDEFALYDEEQNYIPYLTSETLDLIGKAPWEYQIKAFDVQGVKLNLFNRYRKFINLPDQEKPDKQSFIQTVRPFLTFYKGLPSYSKNTQRLSKASLATRNVFAKAKDPEEVFFEELPKALGTNIVQLQSNPDELASFISAFQNSIAEIRSAYDELINRVETFLANNLLGETVEFEKYKRTLQRRYKGLKQHLLLPHQKVFYQRVMSELDDRKAWLSSLAQACIGKSLDVATDNDEAVLYDKIADLVRELDNLCEISKGGFDETKETVLRFEITSFVEGLQKNLIRLPKSKSKDMAILQEQISKKLSKSDKQLNIAALVTLLEEILKDEN